MEKELIRLGKIVGFETFLIIFLLKEYYDKKVELRKAKKELEILERVHRI